MSEDRNPEYKEAFTLFDADGDGFITTKELGTVLRALGKSPTEAEIKAIVKDIDPDGKGVVVSRAGMADNVHVGVKQRPCQTGLGSAGQRGLPLACSS